MYTSRLMFRLGLLAGMWTLIALDKLLAQDLLSAAIGITGVTVLFALKDIYELEKRQ